MQNFNINDWTDEFFTYLKDSSSTILPMALHEPDFLAKFLYLDSKGEITELPDDFAGQLVQKRAEYMGLNCTKGFLGLLLLFCRSPGEIVMFLSVFKTVQEANKPVEYQMDAEFLLRETWGRVPSADFFSKMWDKQKGREHGVDNWLDVIASPEAFADAVEKGYVELRRKDG